MKLTWKLLVNTCLIVLLVAAYVPINSVQAATTHHWKHYTQGVDLMNKGKYKEAIAQLKEAVKQTKNASYLRKLAEAYEQDGQFQNAANTYYEEASIHYQLGLKSGDMNTYFAVMAMADALNTEVELYIEDQIPIMEQSGKLAKFEPETGMYIGAFIEKDSGVESKKGEKFAAFNELSGKQHAIYFNYHRYGANFPHIWASQVKEAGGAIHLAVQPEGGLSEVKDDAVLRKFARDAQAAGVPIFLRFASEMNGSWVKWNGNPALYIEKFRLVAKVMKEEAPNVAMVWSPAANPKRNIHDYYPGDDVVDWVGLSIYSVKFFNGDVKSPADQVNPLDSLDYVYNAYADSKPIMVSEYGATHFSKAGNTSTVNFAITKMNMMYHGAKLKYPRLKNINWFSLNTLTDSHSAERSLNNFSLTENSSVLNAYKAMIKDPYYLSKVPSLNAAPAALKQSVVSIEDQAARGKQATITAWIKTYDPYIGKVVFSIDGKQVAEKKQYPYQFKIDPKNYTQGKHKLTVAVYDSKGRVASTKQATLTIGAEVEALNANRIAMHMNEKYVYTSKGKLELPVAPFTSQGRTLVPLRFISNVLGADVKWNGTNKTITIKGNSTIVLTEGSKTVTVNGTSSQLEVAPVTVKGTTFVPLRFVNEKLGGKVSYDSKKGRIIVSTS